VEAVRGMWGLCFYLTTLSDIHIRRRGIQIVSFYGKPYSLTCPVYSTDTREHLSWKEPLHISFLVIFVVQSEGVKLAMPWSAVKCFTTEPVPALQTCKYMRTNQQLANQRSGRSNVLCDDCY